MGKGDPDAVHTVLHHRFVEAHRPCPGIPREELPVEALERAALGGLLATNRWLQPEMLGALGLTELQAGPRCRLVLKAFDRLGAPADAYPFYVEHAKVDPIHGRDWVDKAVVAARRPSTRTGDPGSSRARGGGPALNLAFFERMRLMLTGDEASLRGLTCCHTLRP